MKTKHYLFTCLSLCFFTVFIACQAQDSTRIDSAIIEAIYNDPLAVGCRAADQRIADLILYGKVDIEAYSPVMDKAGGPCESLLEDMSHIRGAEEYATDLCEFITSRNSIAKKYPEYLRLTRSQRCRIVFAKRTPITEQEIDQLIDIRRSPDR